MQCTNTQKSSNLCNRPAGLATQMPRALQLPHSSTDDWFSTGSSWAKILRQHPGCIATSIAFAMPYNCRYGMILILLIILYQYLNDTVSYDISVSYSITVFGHWNPSISSFFRQWPKMDGHDVFFDFSHLLCHICRSVPSDSTDRRWAKNLRSTRIDRQWSGHRSCKSHPTRRSLCLNWVAIPSLKTEFSQFTLW